MTNKKTLYCHSCGKIVKKEQAEVVCYPLRHDIEEGESLFSENGRKEDE